MNIDFKQFRKDFSNAVKQLEEQYGLTIEPGNISFNDNDFTMKVKYNIYLSNSKQSRFNSL